MNDPFLGARLKLQRARQQIEVLDKEIEAYLASEPYQPAVDFNRDAQILTARVTVQRQPDPMWGVHIGEIVHNLRSALDHIVWRLVIRAGHAPKPADKNQFPVFMTEPGFDDRGIKFLKNVSSDAVSLIKSEQPFSTGEDANSPLWHLHELSNFDKHRTLHLTGTLLHQWHMRFSPLKSDIRVRQLERRTGGMIEEHAVLWRMQIDSNVFPFANKEVEGALAVDVAFANGTPAVGGWLVRHTLIDIASRTERISSRIASELYSIELGLQSAT